MRERDKDFLSRWTVDKPTYDKFGQYVVDQIVKAVEAGQPRSAGEFFKIPPISRTKADNSLVEKAFYRGKQYADPYLDITDKVGARLIALLGTELRIIETALLGIPSLNNSRDRDYEEEQNKNPIAFQYAAIHYVVRSKGVLNLDGITIPAGTPCEVQIKSVLQHAYSELTHDTLYKPQVDQTPTMQRNAAKAQALLEATNDYFEKVHEEVAASLARVREMTRELSHLYNELVSQPAHPSALEGMLLESYESKSGSDYAAQIRKMFEEKGYLAKIIKERALERNPIALQPAVLLVYLDIYKRKERSVNDWPLTRSEMEPFLNDLGESAA